MTDPLSIAFARLPGIDTLRDRAAAIDVAATRVPVNSHIHLPPNFSAFDSVAQATELAAAQAVGVLGVSNYYDYSIYGLFTEQVAGQRIFPMYGLEIIVMIDDLRDSGIKVNDPGNPGKTYVCGKGITKFADMSDRASALLQQIRDADRERMATMIEKLGAVCSDRGFDTGLNERGVVDMIVNRHGSLRETVYIQERHIAQAFQEAVFDQADSAERPALVAAILGQDAKDANDHVGIQGEIRSHLMKAGKPAFAEETFITLSEAAELILELGGIPSYPTLADGTSPICAFEDPPDKLLGHLRDYDFHAVEYIPIRNTAPVLTEYVTAMRTAGLIVTAGTEHNTLDLIGIEPTCVGGAPIPEAIKEIFWEGACVVAAHQYLGYIGEPGFVDSNGVPNRSYATADERIDAFARLGAAVIEAYRNP